jgi:hypothetical protein
MSEKLVEINYVSGVTVYSFVNNSRQACDEYMAFFKIEMQKHVDAGKQDEPYPYILDVSKSGIFPIQYMIASTKPIIASFDPFPENYIAYVTSNLNDAILVNLISGMTARGFAHKRKLFHIDDFDEAIDWLTTINS